jgi:hypothetical protein
MTLPELADDDVDVFLAGQFKVLPSMLDAAERNEDGYRDAVAQLGRWMRDDPAWFGIVSRSTAWYDARKHIAAHRNSNPWWNIQDYVIGKATNAATEKYFDVE